MALAVDRLPTDPERRRAIIVEQAAALATKEAELHVRDLLVEKLQTQLAVTAMPDSTNSTDRPSIEDGRLECPLHCSPIREEAVGCLGVGPILADQGNALLHAAPHLQPPFATSIGRASCRPKGCQSE